ncbi:MAG: hypothetical protein KC418_08280 [Anaerolineales bacterium]|nr:hypothetical protein [Anaerolineales bacterium]MCB8951953.1 stage 0 sporulation protein [Ardenticatenales bacterium]
MTTLAPTPTVTDVIGIRFQKLGKLYHFGLTPEQIEDIKPGDYVVVETKRGRQLGQVIAFVPPEQVNRRRALRNIERRATPRDLVLQQVWEARELDALITCREKAYELGLQDTRFIKATYSFDGSWITYYYTTENKNLDIRTLRSTLGRHLRTRVEMQIIGPRDVAKMLGGFGACGQPRCCSTFLTDFSPVSIRMAKAQGVSLSPQEITGMCGRLRCCLVYEYEQYVEAKKGLPKKGKRVRTPHGDGVVKDVLPLKEMVRVDVDGEWFDVARHELEPLDELEALERKAEAGCSRHEGGECDCGARKPTDDADES